MAGRNELDTYAPIPIDVLGTDDALNIVLPSTNTHAELCFAHGILTLGIKPVN